MIVSKRWAWLALLPLLASAAAPDDYARQWPLQLSKADGGAYRVMLDREVYRSLHTPGLDDLDVLNAAGTPVPAALLPAAAPLEQAPRQVSLPWFPLPVATVRDAVDLSVISRRDADGAVLTVETRTAAGPGPAPAFLVDASRLREPIPALVLDWDTDGAAFDLGYRVEGSDDLRTWRVLQSRAALVDLTHGGERLRQQRVPVRAQVRYLRLVPLQDAAGPALTAVHAELPSAPAATEWTWETVTGRRVEASEGVRFEFELQGRFPVQQVDLDLEGNSAAEWTLSSRDSDTGTWQHRAGPWVVYRLQGDDASGRSLPQTLDATVRDRYWRLAPKDAAAAAAPILRLGYRLETVVFLAQGAGPYTLVAGSARARRAEAPIQRMLDALRVQRGTHWEPLPAGLGTSTELAGDAALRPAPPPHDWKAWLLWGLLVAGAGLVALFAVSLLRRKA